MKGIEINIPYKSDSPRETIERLGLYLQSSFTAISTMSRNLERDDSYVINPYSEDIQNLADIGYALAFAVFREASELESNADTFATPQTGTLSADLLIEKDEKESETDL